MLLLLLFGNYRFYKTLVGSKCSYNPVILAFQVYFTSYKVLIFFFFLDADIPRRKESRTVSRVRQTTGCPGKDVSL